MWDVNDRGDVVGEAGNLGWLLKDGTHFPIQVQGAVSTRPQGLNNHGDVVGFYHIDVDPSPEGEQIEPRAFRYSNGNVSTIPTPTSRSYAYDINDDRMIVGAYQPNDFTIHSFVSGPSGFVTVATPSGASLLNLSDINNASVAVGAAAYPNGDYTFWRYAGGVLSQIVMPPSATCSSPYLLSLNEADVASGWCAEGTSFVLAGGVQQTIAVPGASFTYLLGSNASGTIAGSYIGSDDLIHGFLLKRPSLVDPVPDLLEGPAVTTTPSSLATEGRAVQGAAADGVARVVVRIPASTAGQQFTVRLLNDREPRALSTSSQEDGALAVTGAQTSWVSRVTVAAEQDTGPTPMAFVLYKAPADFPRADGQDEAKASRRVYLEITPTGGQPYLHVVEIVRPPVLVVHGLWSDRGAWNRFSPFISGPSHSSSRFTIQRSDYSRLVSSLVGPIEATVPAYPASDLHQIRANALGFDFNADLVEDDVAVLLRSAKLDNNPLGLPVASVQVDVVAHSMGGAIVRTIQTRPTNFGWQTFGAGPFHKLITIDTPHRGSPVATQLIRPANACMRRRIALFAPNFALQSAVIAGTAGTTNGAVGDLVESPLSGALQRLSSSGVRPLLVSFVAGTYDDWPALEFAFNAVLLRLTCDDPLSEALTPDGWPTVFGHELNDAIVSRTSQIDGLGGNAVFERAGYLHSDGTAALGFSKPSILDPGQVPDYVIRALNQPAYDTSFFRQTPPTNGPVQP